MSDRDLSDLNPSLQPLCRSFLDQCSLAGINVFITQTYRNEADQNADYAQGRTTPGHIITNAQYGQSPHNCVDADGNPTAKAFDFAIKSPTGELDWDATDAAWTKAIQIGESLGLVSGSTWRCSLKDYPHFELPNWNSQP
jgi:peptidoglycan L-alanyl-D-glutamate endopeptidase CwlK